MHGRPHLTGTTVVVVLVAVAGLASAALLVRGGPGIPDAAPSAGSPACRASLAAGPELVNGRPRTPVEVAGALAWVAAGDAPVVVRCGLPAAAPTTTACLDADGVDWVQDDAGDPVVFTLYGHDPTLEVRVPRPLGAAAAVAALADLRPMVDALPANGRRCVG